MSLLYKYDIVILQNKRTKYGNNMSYIHQVMDKPTWVYYDKAKYCVIHS